MHSAIHVLVVTISALFPIVDPLSGSPIFLAMTRGCTPPLRRRLSLRVAVDSLFLMLGSYFIGSHVLAFFGVSLPVVEVAGGLVVVGLGWTLLLQKDESPDGAERTVEPRDPLRRAFYPLTLPLTVGPGAIAVAVTLGAKRGPPVWHPHSGGRGRSAGHGSDCPQRLRLLRVRGPADAGARANGHEDRSSARFVSPAVYRGTDRVEWSKHVALLRGSARALGELRGQGD